MHLICFKLAIQLQENGDKLKLKKMLIDSLIYGKNKFKSSRSAKSEKAVIVSYFEGDKIAYCLSIHCESARFPTFLVAMLLKILLLPSLALLLISFMHYCLACMFNGVHRIGNVLESGRPSKLSLSTLVPVNMRRPSDVTSALFRMILRNERFCLIPATSLRHIDVVS